MIHLITFFIIDRQQNKEENKIKTAVVGTGKNAEKTAVEIKRKLKKNSFFGFIAKEENIDSKREMRLRATISQIESIVKENLTPRDLFVLATPIRLKK